MGRKLCCIKEESRPREYIQHGNQLVVSSLICCIGFWEALSVNIRHGIWRCVVWGHWVRPFIVGKKRKGESL